MAPFELISIFGKFVAYAIFLFIGLGFGAVLEMSGFGDSRKLAAQFYLKDMTVLKVMFTGIIVAMVLIFGAAAFGFLDFDRVFVTETYLLPGIIGGLIMGVGFIIGGFCPGTSIVALATLKIDGFFFAAGVTFGVFLFGESVSIFQGFHNSTYMGRFILPELFDADTGVIVVAVVFMALFMFYGAEISERFFGKKLPIKDIKLLPENGKKVILSALLVFAALVVMFTGQPTPADKWAQIEARELPKLDNRDVFIHPGELADVMNDPMLYTTILDVRSETDYNLFHLENARRLTLPEIARPEFRKQMINAPANTIVAVVSNNEADAVEAYKQLKGQGIFNLYILEGGINHWLKLFPLPKDVARLNSPVTPLKGDQLNYTFQKAVGASLPNANPDPQLTTDLKYTKKIQMQKKSTLSGGCG